MDQQTASAASGNALPSVWPGLWRIDAQGPHLLGGMCKSCGATVLQVRRICPSCWEADTIETAPIGRESTLYTYTIIHQPPPGFAAPFAVGYVDLPEGIRVFAHLERTPEALRIGGKLQLAIMPLKKAENGELQYGPQYRASPPTTRTP